VLNTGRKDAAVAEGGDESHAIPVNVIADDVVVRRDQGAQIFAEGDVDRWTVIEGTYAHVENVTRDHARLVGQTTGEIVGNVSLGQNTCTVGREPNQVGGTPSIDADKGGEHCRDEHRPARMRLDAGLVVRAAGLVA